METNINLQLGDIIEIEASANPELHQKTFIINYIDNEKIILVNNEGEITLNIKPNGELYEESIETINILSRADTPSYAQQNGYTPGTWISIYFRGTFPIIINGIITNIENDMIEIKTYPKNEIIYIDFEYKGIPEQLNIDTIKIIDQKDVLIEGVYKESSIDQEQDRPRDNLDDTASTDDDDWFVIPIQGMGTAQTSFTPSSASQKIDPFQFETAVRWIRVKYKPGTGNAGTFDQMLLRN